MTIEFWIGFACGICSASAIIMATMVYCVVRVGSLSVKDHGSYKGPPEGLTKPEDLLPPPPPPVRYEYSGWINVYPYPDSNKVAFSDLHPNRVEADNHADRTRIACLPTGFFKGDGLGTPDHWIEDSPYDKGN